MTKTLLIGLAGLFAATAVQAQTPAPGAPPPPPPRARGPALSIAVEGAQAAIAACLANGYKTTALVTTSVGIPVALLSTDGAAERTQGVAASKIGAVIRYKVPSGDVADRAAKDAALAAEIKADPKIGTARRGALPLVVGGDFIGAFAVSGAPGGDKDEVCVKAALDKIGGRLK